MIDFAFIAERYNYWIFIILMMMGLYIVIARGNLVKKIIGLNVFQTSVFIYYISIGKIAGGTAPILIGGEDHGGGHGDESHGGETGHASSDAAGLHAAPGEAGEGLAVNDLSDKIANTPPGAHAAAEALHAAPSANPPLTEAPAPSAPTFESVFSGEPAAPAGELVHQTAEIIYTNPLPHVLILTAIVVGVATTAVGLALAVRIREAYGTIEEDELEAADDIAEFGRDMSLPGGRV